MDAWRDIRLKARECHRQALLKSKDVRKAPALLAAALEDEDLQLTHYTPGSVVSKGVHGFFDRPSKIINVASGQSPENEAVVTAHELGHYKLHRDPRNEVTAIALALAAIRSIQAQAAWRVIPRASARKFKPIFSRASFSARPTGCAKNCSRMVASPRTSPKISACRRGLS